MPVTRLNNFTAKAGQEQALGDVLASAIPTVKAAAGCLSVQLLQSHSTPTRFVVIEVWDSLESHQAAMKAIPRESIATVMPLLDGMPGGDYWVAPRSTV